MRNWQRLFFLFSSIVTTISGISFGYMKYLLEPESEFAVVNHWLQPAMLKVHIISAAVMLFFLGTLLMNHVLPYLKARKKQGRRSGLLNVFIIPLMALSGYLVQVFSTEVLLNSAARLHIGSSFLFIVVFIVHEFRARSRAPWQIICATLGIIGLSWGLALL